mgnify:CR=1 FL=1
MRRKGKALESVDNISFVIETMHVFDGHKLGKLTSDKEGYYLNIPMAVLGTVTQNNTYYQVDRFKDEISGQESLFRKTLADGKLYGEYGHPGELNTLGRDAMLKRLLTVEPKNQSHHIKRVGTGRRLENGGLIIDADVKPFGPYGDHLKESLESNSMNTAFSLRSASKSQTKNGVTHRTMLRLVTFDYVCSGGYFEASKRYVTGSGMEEHVGVFAEPGNTSNGVLMDYVAYEHVGNEELNDILGAHHIVKERRQATYFPQTDAVRRADKPQLIDSYLSFIRRE